MNISSNQDINILASIVTGGGNGDIVANNNLNIKSGLNEYYSMYYHMEAEMDIGAIVVGAAVGVGITALTGGTGGLALAASAFGGAMIGSQAQSGTSDTQVTSAQTVVGSSILFNHNLNLVTNTLSLESSNIKTGEDLNITTKEFNISSKEDSVLLKLEHTDISANYLNVVLVAGVAAAMSQGAINASKAGVYGMTIQAGIKASPLFVGGAIGKIASSPTMLIPDSFFTNYDTTSSSYSNGILVNSVIEAGGNKNVNLIE